MRDTRLGITVSCDPRTSSGRLQQASLVLLLGPRGGIRLGASLVLKAGIAKVTGLGGVPKRGLSRPTLGTFGFIAERH